MTTPTGQVRGRVLEMLTVGPEGATATTSMHRYTRLAPHPLLSVSSHPPSLAPHNHALSDPALWLALAQRPQLLSTEAAAKRSVGLVNSPSNDPAVQTPVRSYPSLSLPLQLLSGPWILQWPEEQAAWQCARRVLDPTERYVRETVGAGVADDADAADGARLGPPSPIY